MLNIKKYIQLKNKRKELLYDITDDTNDIDYILPGTLIFVRDHKSIWSKLIAWYESIEDINFHDKIDTLPSHVEVYIGDGECVSADFTGVKVTKLNRHFTDFETVYTLDLSILDSDKREKICRFALSKVGTLYDLPGVLSFLLKIPIIKYLVKDTIIARYLNQVDFAYFCSELAALSYEYAGVRLAVDSVVSPAHLMYNILTSYPATSEIKKIWQRGEEI